MLQAFYNRKAHEEPFAYEDLKKDTIVESPF